MSTISSASLEIVQRAYLAYYGRPADHAGLQYWASALDKAKGDLKVITANFGNTAESEALYGGNSLDERVEKIYQQIFNRPADAAGKAWWIEHIEDGTYSVEAAALALLEGAFGTGDEALVTRKLEAAAQFTAALHGQKMSHWYNADSIAAARDFLSGVTANTTATTIDAALEATLGQITAATWAHYSGASNTGLGTLSSADGFTGFEGGLMFANSGWSSSFAGRDVFLASINDQLQPGLAARIGHAEFNERLDGLTTGADGSFLLWGKLDNSSNNETKNLQFVWQLDANLQPLAEVRIGTSQGSAPEINKVIGLSNGKTLVVGSQNNVGDSWDAFALVLNDDLSVHAQQRFDAPTRNGSNESFLNALELDNGELVLVAAAASCSASISSSSSWRCRAPLAGARFIS